MCTHIISPLLGYATYSAFKLYSFVLLLHFTIPISHLINPNAKNYAAVKGFIL